MFLVHVMSLLRCLIDTSNKSTIKLIVSSSHLSQIYLLFSLFWGNGITIHPFTQVILEPYLSYYLTSTFCNTIFLIFLKYIPSILSPPPLPWVTLVFIISYLGFLPLVLLWGETSRLTHYPHPYSFLSDLSETDLIISLVMWSASPVPSLYIPNPNYGTKDVSCPDSCPVSPCLSLSTIAFVSQVLVK